MNSVWLVIARRMQMQLNNTYDGMKNDTNQQKKIQLLAILLIKNFFSIILNEIVNETHYRNMKIAFSHCRYIKIED